MRSIKLTCILVASFVVQVCQAQTVPPFQTGDRVAFVGNSITDGGHYHSYIWLYYMTHFPDRRITCFNVGVGGDDVRQMSDRFAYEVLPLKPTCVTLTWGMNDSHYFEWLHKEDSAAKEQQYFDTAKARYAVLEKQMKAHAEFKKIFILGSPYDASTKSNKQNLFPGKSALFQRLIDFQEQTAKANGWYYVDFDHPMLEINAKGQETDSLFSLTPNDRIHPDYPGHLIMASLFLKAQGFADQPVADFALDAKTKTVAKSINCHVTEVSGSGDDIRFNYLANALPFPIDTVAQKEGWGKHRASSEALGLIPWMQTFDKEMLTVTGLKPGIYRLLMDGQEIGQFGAEAFGSGINLAEQTYTPEYQQSLAIMHLNEMRWEIEKKTRQYSYVEFDLLKGKGLLYADNKAAMDAVSEESAKNPFVRGDRDSYIEMQYKAVRDGLRAEQEALVNAIYASNKPKVHHIELKIVQ